MDKEMESRSRPEGVGSFLKRERESRGLTLEEIAEQTRIQRAHLMAIENEDFERLPAGPFATGFIEAYARQLGLAPNKVLALLRDDERAAFSPSRDVGVERAQQRLTIRDIPVGSASRPAFPRRIVVMLLLLLGLGLAFWLIPPLRASIDSVGALLTFTKGASEEDKGERSIDDGTDAHPAATDSSQEPGHNTSEAGDKAPNEHDGGEAPPQTTDDEHTASASRQAQSTLQASTLSQGGIEKRPSIDIKGQSFDVYTDRRHAEGTPQTVSLIAEHKTYLRVSSTPEGAPVFEGILQPNEQKTLSAASDLYLIVGNIGGVRIEYNGKPLEHDGREGERRGLAFRLSPP